MAIVRWITFGLLSVGLLLGFAVFLERGFVIEALTEHHEDRDEPGHRALSQRETGETLESAFILGALAHPHRAAIVSTLVRMPAASRAEIARQVSLSRGGARYHLRKLINAGWVRCYRRGKLRCYALDSGETLPFWEGASDVLATEFFHAIHHPVRRAVLDAARERAGSQRIRTRLREQGLEPPNPSGLSKHCSLLQKAGLLHRQRVGREVYWYAPFIPTDWKVRHVKTFLMRSGLWSAVIGVGERTRPSAESNRSPFPAVVDFKRARHAVEALGLVQGGANEDIARILRST